MREPALVIVKPDGISKQLVGHVFSKFAQSRLDIIGLRVVKVTRALAEKHYMHLKDKPFFDEIVAYLSGGYHRENKLIAVIYYGENAIKKCRVVAGATNPEQACGGTIRGSYGRITTKGLFENVVHVSSDKKEAEREIKLWFEPDDILVKIYPVQMKAGVKKERVWK